MGDRDPRDEIDRRRRRQGRWGLGVGAGLLLLLSIFTAGFFLYAVLVVGGLATAAFLWAAASLQGIRLERRLSTAEVEVGGDAGVSATLHNDDAMPAFWLVWRELIDPGLAVEGCHGTLVTVSGRGSSRLDYRLRPGRRGLFRIGPAVVEAGDPAGLIRRFHVDGDARFLTVLPRTVPLERGLALGRRPVHEVPRRSVLEDPSRFIGTRPYRVGDSLRRVHWRATARTGRLEVKLFEPAVLEGVLLAVDAWDGGGRPAAEKDDLLELGVTAAASLADHVLAGGQSVGLLSNGTDAAERFPRDWRSATFRRLDQALAAGTDRREVPAHRPVEVPPARGGPQRQRLLQALARLEPVSALSLAELLIAELPRLPRSLVLLAITARPDAALAAALASLERSGMEAAIVWIGGSGDAAPPSLPPRTPVYPVADLGELRRLGAEPL